MTGVSPDHSTARETDAMSLTVCVFGGTRPGRHPHAMRLARELGRALARRGHRLVYGAGEAGVMGAAAVAAARAGADVTGILPGWLHELEGGPSLHGGKVLITDDLFERKRTMLELADGFVALPGGFGTVDEILEVVSLNYLGRMGKPLAVLDVDGCWSALLRLFDDMEVFGFADSAPLFKVFHDTEKALDFVESAARWPVTPVARSNAPVGA